MPIKALSGLLEGVRDLLPFSDAKRGPLSELTTSGSSSKAGVVFERGAFQITVNGADGLDDLEGQLTEILSRAALRLGVANG